MWEGCNKLVCEKHVSKFYDDGVLVERSKHLLHRLFYEFERFRPPDEREKKHGPLYRAMHRPAVHQELLVDFLGRLYSHTGIVKQRIDEFYDMKAY